MGSPDPSRRRDLHSIFARAVPATSPAGRPCNLRGQHLYRWVWAAPLPHLTDGAEGGLPEGTVGIAIGIMGFGRIGRNLFRILHTRPEIQVVAIVDIADPLALEYLLKFDTVHGRFPDPLSVKGEALHVQGRQIRMLRIERPEDVPWGELGVEIVVDATKKFRTRKALEGHLQGGARKVVTTVPPLDEIDNVIVMGVNDAALQPGDRIVSNASVTANCLAPIASLLHDAFGIDRAFMTTVHAFTNDQRLADVPHDEIRRSRAAAENIIPTATGAPQMVESIVPSLRGKLDGIAMRVPVLDGSTVDLVSLMKRDLRREEVNEVVRSAAASTFQGIIEFTEDPIVSSDVVGNPHSAVFDSLATQVIGGNLLKTISWYDNGWGHAQRAVDLVERMASLSTPGPGG